VHIEERNQGVPTRESVAGLYGTDAVKIRKHAPRSLFVEYLGKKFAVGSKYHHREMERALRAKFAQCEAARKALLGTKDKNLIHLVHRRNEQGDIHIGKDSSTIPADVFVKLLLKIRGELLISSKDAHADESQHPDTLDSESSSE